MNAWNHHNVNVILSVDLFLWNDDLDWWNVFSTFDWVVQNTNASDNFLNKSDSLFKSTFQSISWIANNCWAMGDTISTFNSNNFTIFEKNFVDISVQHECSTIDGTDSGETFWNTSQSVNWINEWWISVSSHWVHVQLNFSNNFNGWKVHKSFISIKSDSVTNKINSVFFQPEFLEHCFSWGFHVNFFVSLWVVFFEILHGFHELLTSSFLHHSHKIGW